MTSECYVYITLPGETNAVTAGKYAIVSRPGDPAVGKFVYGKRYLDLPNAVDLDPTQLLRRLGEYASARLNGNFGALRDASPDSWGRRLIEKRLGVDVLSELDYLLNSPDDRAGALGFGLGVTPPAPERPFNRRMHLSKLVEIADKLAAADDDPSAMPTGPEAEQVDDLLRMGTAMGGARPKATVEDADGLWLAKFPHRRDKWNNTRVEHAMLTLARQCGISSAESRIENVAGRDVILVKRFDRHKTEGGYLRSRMVSALTLLDADDSPNSDDMRAKWSYLLLADDIKRFSASHGADLEDLFRRICFNALVSNNDDHPRNHAIIAKNTDWRLSPAYDLTPNPLVSEERRDLALTIGRYGRYATRANLLSESRRFELKEERAQAIVDQMTEIVAKRWYPTCREASVTEKDCESIRRAFVYPAFTWSEDQVRNAMSLEADEPTSSRSP
jgi:serine/threonine-protein kinase HipA